LLQTLLNLEGNGVPWLDSPGIQPHPQTILLQALSQSMDGFFILGAVAQKNVILERLSIPTPVIDSNHAVLPDFPLCYSV
jgi:hypothetical protein